jgi:isoamylase
MKTSKPGKVTGLLSLFLGLASVWLGTCSSPLVGTGEISGNTGRIVLGAVMSRNLLSPDFAEQISSYELVLKQEGSQIDTVFQTESVKTWVLVPGVYSVEVWGLNSEIQRAMGASQEVEVRRNQSSSLVLTLEPLSTGMGEIRWSLDTPASVGVDEMVISIDGQSQTTVHPFPGAVGRVQLDFTTSLRPGQYRMVGSLRKEGRTLAVLVRTLKIYPVFVTGESLVLQTEDFSAPPVMPSSIRGVPQGTSINLGWQDSSSTETSFVLEYSVDNGPYLPLAELEAESVHFVHDGLNLGSLYSYRLASRNAFGQSGWLVSGDIKTIDQANVGQRHPLSGPFSPVDADSWSGSAWPLGAHFVAGKNSDVEIAVYSGTATRVLLEIYGDYMEEDATYDYWMARGPDDIWRAKLADLPDGTYYAFRVWGPNWPWHEDWKRGNSSAGFVADYSTPNGTLTASNLGDYDVYRFNPNKVLHDPYAYELSHDTENPYLLAAGERGEIFGTSGADVDPSHVYSGPSTDHLPRDRRDVDTGPWAPKGIILEVQPYTGRRSFVDQKDQFIYEAHVRGLSAHPSSMSLESILGGLEGFEGVKNVPDAYRGTYKGAAFLAPYLAALGVNTVEFVPIHETRNDLHALLADSVTPDTEDKNYWGYMTYGFFAPDRYYAYDKSPGGPTREFKEMVAVFADHGIEVYLDVVYNHSGEGGNWDAAEATGFNSLGGFDAGEYYHLNPFSLGMIEDGATGVGNQLNFSDKTGSILGDNRARSITQKLVIDSLEYWINNMGVSGFRFDLAAVLGRRPNDHLGKGNYTEPGGYWAPDGAKSFYTHHNLLERIADLGESTSTEMVAEAWDIWGYPVGSFPGESTGSRGWGEWNGRYRDSVRRFLKGDGNTHDFNTMFSGDPDHFADQGGPEKTINFIVAHDGFTLADLVSYNEKNNLQSWPFGPSDGGSSSNDSWDSDGDQALRRQRIRNFWVIQIMSRGVPLIVWGDEFARTQKGNNNPYNLDSVVTWNNYGMIATDSPHSLPTGDHRGPGYSDNLGSDHKGDNLNNLFVFAKNMINLRQSTSALRGGDYSIAVDFLEIDGISPQEGSDRAQTIILRPDGGKAWVLLINMWEQQLPFTLPAGHGTWKRIADTGTWAEGQNNFWPEGSRSVFDSGSNYGVNPYSIVLMRQD